MVIAVVKLYTARLVLHALLDEQWLSQTCRISLNKKCDVDAGHHGPHFQRISVPQWVRSSSSDTLWTTHPQVYGPPFQERSLGNKLVEDPQAQNLRPLPPRVVGCHADQGGAQKEAAEEPRSRQSGKNARSASDGVACKVHASWWGPVLGCCGNGNLIHDLQQIIPEVAVVLHVCPVLWIQGFALSMAMRIVRHDNQAKLLHKHFQHMPVPSAMLCQPMVEH
eukprot:CAMPEP_0202371084 /NCGR_PEP_ID=MMETSP1127-20130417/2565_1 /ASSEMBLY_ACC=CAM_ASM_000462 /TAXON_ID=3047 /ORGANISM="Dunaliella tertiolecta, Strain CCMP1320" /LENGTH=221 /DNA_ID=CAMNT_0048967219 /DNA_START=406 /DNA_END=1072 /DNA_ORIENTATION=-